MLTSVSLQQGNIKKFKKLMKIVNIEEENLHIQGSHSPGKSWKVLEFEVSWKVLEFLIFFRKSWKCPGIFKIYSKKYIDCHFFKQYRF